MDSNNPMDEWIDEEVDQDYSDVGIRSYQCVFCKRGFTTAQALGGHMNIHRKDRAKTRPTNSTSKKDQDEYNNYTGPRFYQPISSCYAAAGQRGAQIHYRTFFPASTSSTSNFQFVDDRMEKNIRAPGNENDGLDLELRLGH